jgi:hypothetical protein
MQVVDQSLSGFEPFSITHGFPGLQLQSQRIPTRILIGSQKVIISDGFVISPSSRRANPVE